MGLVERLKILLQYQEGNAKSGVSRSGNLSGVFILYPLIFLLYYATMEDSALSPHLSKAIFYLGILIWLISLLLTVLDFLYNNQLLIEVSTGLMFLYYLFTSPISNTTFFGDGDIQLILVQELSFILYPIIWELILAYTLVTKHGEIRSEKTRKRLAYLASTPLLLVAPLITIKSLLPNLIPGYYDTYLFWGLNLVFSFMLTRGWAIILYPLRHKTSSAVDLDASSKIQSQAVNALNETLEEKHFDKDKFKGE